ncbi:MlaA family lipoprotein [Novilysobacter erysipheiresistens]|uniref:MlaA family lipoprotein n=1 Tax=Novilysobacter erysipheiresistens TaxID=1749332 RepID=A0ABU7YXX2_9GAMM
MRPHAIDLPAHAAGPLRRARALALGLLLAAGASGCTSTPAVRAEPPAVAATPPASADGVAVAAGPTAPTTATTLATEIEPADATSGSTTAEFAATEPLTVDPDLTTADPAADPTAAPTQAELDFAAIYGGQDPYNPVADPTLPQPTPVAETYDPWQRYNRQMHRFNNLVDRSIARPLARAYVAVVPRPVRLGVRNFFSNLGQPVSAVNALLQGKPKQAAHAIGRFALNTTLGIGGIFDPASDAKLSRRSEDFGQTLGIWGWEKSRYVELPLFGPRTVRDVFGMIGDAPLSPLRQVNDDATRIPLQGLQLVDVRTQLLATDSLRAGAADDYALVRDAWMQRRDYQIFGDRVEEGEDVALPEYMRDDSLPIVPAAAVPVMPTDG